MSQKAKNKKEVKQERALRQELLENIHRAKYELECANQNFSYATDPVLIDMYSYQIKACQAHYHYLMERAKQCGLSDHGCLLAYSVSR